MKPNISIEWVCLLLTRCRESERMAPEKASPARVTVCEPNLAEPVKPQVIKMTPVRKRRVNAF